MVRKRGSLSTVLVVAFLTFMVVVATALAAQEVPVRQRPNAQTGGAPQPIAKEDCIFFNPATMTVQQIKGKWCVADPKGMAVRVFSDKAVADRSLAIIQHYGMNQQCFVGRGDPHFLQYNLVSGASPVGPLADECCLPFNPATTTVRQIKGHWAVTDGKQIMFSYPEKDKALADQAVVVIKKYGFTCLCFVLDRPGGDKVPFSSYLRK